MRARYVQKLGLIQKWMHFDALADAGCGVSFSAPLLA